MPFTGNTTSTGGRGSGGGGGGRGGGGGAGRGGSGGGGGGGTSSSNKTTSRSYPRGVGPDFRKLTGLTLLSYIDHHGKCFWKKETYTRRKKRIANDSWRGRG
jgi:hypothetical protein